MISNVIKNDNFGLETLATQSVATDQQHRAPPGSRMEIQNLRPHH